MTCIFKEHAYIVKINLMKFTVTILNTHKIMGYSKMEVKTNNAICKALAKRFTVLRTWFFQNLNPRSYYNTNQAATGELVT